MRVYAWLHTTPEKQDQTRYERYMTDGIAIVIPEVKCMYLFEYLLKMGVMCFSGMVNVPLTWSEIKSWSELTGTVFSVWEVQTLRRASEIYVEQVDLSRKADAPMPERIIVQDQAKLAKRIKSEYIIKPV